MYTIIYYIATPMITGAVGFLTNDLAIRMLFHPHKPKYIFGKRVWFTPGLIPKEHKRIAASLGASISQNLMNQEVLERTLLNEMTVSKIESALSDTFASIQQEDCSLKEYLLRFVSPDEIAKVETSISEEVGLSATDMLINHKLGNQVAKMAVDHAIESIKEGVMGLLGADKIINHLREPAERLLRDNINQMLEKKGPDMVHSMIKSGVSDLLNTPVKRLLEGKDEQLKTIQNAIIHIYKNAIESQLPKMLETLNIAKIIEERINELDMDEMERLIMEVMKRELSAIVWLGAGLGFIIGLIDCLLF